MKAMLGEEGTEQFTIETRVDGVIIKTQPIHDPFLHNTTMVSIGRWACLLGIFRRRWIRVEVSVSGSQGAQRAIMMLDPEQLQRDTDEILEDCRVARESSPTVGLYCADQADA